MDVAIGKQSTSENESSLWEHFSENSHEGNGASESGEERVLSVKFIRILEERLFEFIRKLWSDET